MSDRTAEIWSTRLQRELLALTSPPEEDAGDKADGDDDTSEATPKHDNTNIADLPPFIRLRDHSMNIERGLCTVTFAVEVEKKAAAPKSEDGGGGGGDEEGPSPPKEGEESEQPQQQEEEGKEPPSPEKDEGEEKPHVLITLDASMEDVHSSNPVCYPFLKPRAILTEGAGLFPPKSTIEDGDLIDLDCDWTPSLHLSDAALNVALKVKESIRRGDPFFPSAVPLAVGGGGGNSIENANSAAVASLLTGKNFLPTMGKKKPKSPPVRKKSQHPSQVRIGDEVDLSEPPYSVCAGMFSCKAIRRPEFVEKAIAEAAARQDSHRVAERNAALDETEVEENEIPSGPGNYMRLQAGGIRKVAGAGLVGAGSLFKSFVQKTQAVLEESFLMVTQDHLLELKSSKFSIDSATVTFVSPISLLAKLKFRREESISLFFKQAPDDPLILMCHESAQAVQQIQAVLKRHGVKGKHTNAATQRAIQAALQLVMQIQAKESSLEDDPSVEKVNEIMDLYRQAAEKFETAGDARHEEVMDHMRKFLAKPVTAGILDGSYQPPAKSEVAVESSGSSPHATIVAVPPKVGGTEDDDDDLAKEEAKLSVGAGKEESSAAELKNDAPTKKVVDPGYYEDTMKQADDILNEVENLGVADDDDLDDFLSNAATSGGSRAQADDDHDPVAELDAMLSAADKELNDIIDAK